jgi:hypothetical protein
VLEGMDSTASAIIDNARTQLGRRDAYYALYMYHKNKFGSCPVDYYAFVSIFKTWTENKVRGSNSAVKEGLSVPFTVDENGMVKNPVSFTLGLVSGF